MSTDRPVRRDRHCSIRAHSLGRASLLPLLFIAAAGCGIQSPLSSDSKTLSNLNSFISRGPTYAFGQGVSLDHVWTEIGFPRSPEHHQVHLENANVYISFNCDWGHPLWVSWSVTADDLGRVKRSNEFHQESRLPSSNCLNPTPEDYKGSGYDRGHMAPSGDRTASKSGNVEVFSMANIAPQAPQVNQMPWNEFENLTRAYVHRGDEVIVYAGTSGSLGRMPATGINIPEHTWRVVVVVPQDARSNDWYRSEGGIEVFATIFSNDIKAPTLSLQEGLVSVDEVEAITGIDLLSGLDDGSESQLERRVRSPNPF